MSHDYEVCLYGRTLRDEPHKVMVEKVSQITINENSLIFLDMYDNVVGCFDKNVVMYYIMVR